MKKNQLSLEPKPSTILKILMFSKGIKSTDSALLKKKLILNIN